MNNITVDYITMIFKLKKILTMTSIELIMSILNSNTVLCGGLILQTILLEEWPTDIDIFTTDHTLTSIGSVQFDEMKNEYMVIPGIRKVYRGKIEDISIDIVHISCLDDVFSGFDFDFCKVWFDKYNFHMKNPKSVLDKMCIINEDADNIILRKASIRIPKYESRGFIIKRIKLQ
jgi:hypothetical protein